MDSFALTATSFSLSPKRERENEDRVLVIETPLAAAVAVADGVGGVPNSGEMAAKVCELAASHLAEGGVVKGILDLDDQIGEGLSEEDPGATTLVMVGAEPDGSVSHLLLGNGAVIELTPLELTPQRTRLLWTSIALPQMQVEEGRLALRSFLPLSPAPAAEKGCRHVPAGNARLYLVCSDGLLSEEDRAEGKAEDETSWRHVPRAVARLVGELEHGWDELLDSSSEEAGELLRSLLAAALEEPSVFAELDDDTSVGALLMRPLAAKEEG
jgi:hypothetical protein